MSTKTRIIVIRKSQLLIAGIALLAIILLIVLLIHASGSSKKEQDATQTISVVSDVSGLSETSDTTVTSGSSDTSVASGSASTSDTTATSGSASTSDTTATSDTSGTSSALYTPGVYTSTVTLNDTALEVQVVVDENHINSISLTNLSETIETMYPLVSPAMEELSEQIINTQSITGITVSTSNQYTSMVLYEAICEALEKASM